MNALEYAKDYGHEEIFDMLAQAAPVRACATPSLSDPPAVPQE
jgi:hypothetical protein